MPSVQTSSKWPDSVDSILASDQAVTFAHVTPASGVVLTPLTNFGIRDREVGQVGSVNSSSGMWLKLDRVRRNPRVAIAFHTRDHSLTDCPEYVLVQGTATLQENWLDSHLEEWERFGGQSPHLNPLWDWWLRVYHDRVGIDVDVERILVWPDDSCHGEPELHGSALPAEPPDGQSPAARGTGPRVRHRRAARRAARLPHVLLGWVGADGFPLVVPVGVAGAVERGIVLEPRGGLVPEGGRRAGLTAHWFGRYTVGQRQRRYTGWMECEGGRVVYAPHSERGYAFPPWRFAYNLVAGYGTRRGARQARRATRT